jgi:ribosomal protein S12 methylthiotransferase accessory factor
LESFADWLIDSSVAYLEANGRSLWAFDLTTETSIPVVAAVSATAAGDAILFGFAAGFDARSALRAAIAELLQVLGPPELWNRQSMLDRCRLAVDRRIWIHAANLDNQSFLSPREPGKELEDYPVIPETTVSSLLARAVELTRSAGFEVVFRDLTRSETGAAAVKVWVPGLRSAWAHLAPGRLYDAPVRLGWIPETIAEADLNPFPFFL